MLRTVHPLWQDLWNGSIHFAVSAMGGSGKGGDQFIYNSTTDTGKGRKQRDTILDFKGTQGDRIHFKRWMPIPIKQANQSLHFIDDAPFSKMPGERRFASAS